MFFLAGSELTHVKEVLQLKLGIKLHDLQNVLIQDTANFTAT